MTISGQRVFRATWRVKLPKSFCVRPSRSAPRISKSVSTACSTTTSIGVSDIKVKKKLFKKNEIIKSYENELKIPLIPKGKHTLRVLAVPDMDMGWEYEFDFNIRSEDRYVDIDILNGSHQFKGGKKIEKKKNPFDKLDKF